jgi:hypothetical protein
MALVVLCVILALAVAYGWAELALRCRRLADRQGRDPVLWTALAATAPILALIILFLFPTPPTSR